MRTIRTWKCERMLGFGRILMTRGLCRRFSTTIQSRASDGTPDILQTNIINQSKRKEATITRSSYVTEGAAVKKNEQVEKVIEESSINQRLIELSKTPLSTGKNGTQDILQNNIYQFKRKEALKARSSYATERADVKNEQGEKPIEDSNINQKLIELSNTPLSTGKDGTQDILLNNIYQFKRKEALKARSLYAAEGAAVKNNEQVKNVLKDSNINHKLIEPSIPTLTGKTTSELKDPRTDPKNGFGGDCVIKPCSSTDHQDKDSSEVALEQDKGYWSHKESYAGIEKTSSRGDQLARVIEQEAVFVISIKHNSKAIREEQKKISFSMIMRQKRSVLEPVLNKLGGTITKNDWGNSFKLEIQQKHDLLGVYRFLRKHPLRTLKRISFLKWSKAQEFTKQKLKIVYTPNYGETFSR